jgi:murein L,D-transpeptidase YcbB/YkuD
VGVVLAYYWNLLPQVAQTGIVVNIPAYRLEAFDGGRSALAMRVVVGDELDGKNTPIFADSMQFVEFGPYWNVPAGIAIDEILPKVRANPGYLEANEYEVVSGEGEDPPVVRPASLTPEDISAGRYRIRQRPGEKNALGHVKFLFPNDFAVYLHDTPSRSLFAANARADSHGCVRVEDPAALARFVLNDQSEWTAARIDEALGAGKRERITLARPIPVYLVYLTAYVSEGMVHFRDDIYGHDAAIVRLIDADVPNVAARDSLVREAATRLAQRLGRE